MDRPPVDKVDFKLISLNNRGIRDFAKRKAIFSWIEKQNADIAFLQEILSKNGVSNGPGICFHGTNHSRDVLILISDKLQFESKHVKSDTDGRYVFIDALIQDSLF